MKTFSCVLARCLGLRRAGETWDVARRSVGGAFGMRQLRHVDLTVRAEQHIERVDAHEQHQGSEDQQRRDAHPAAADRDLNATARELEAATTVLATAIFDVVALTVVLVVAHGGPSKFDECVAVRAARPMTARTAQRQRFHTARANGQHKASAAFLRPSFGNGATAPFCRRNDGQRQEIGHRRKTFGFRCRLQQ